MFFAEREVWKIPDVPADTPIVPVASVGIIGAGTMGGGIAMNFANAGIPVTIVETQQEALDRGLGVVRANYERSARNGRFPMEDVDRRMGLITGSLSTRRPRPGRPRHRGRVRADGHQEGRVRQARRHLQARRGAGHQHRRA